jgi:hypothetical protein
MTGAAYMVDARSSSYLRTAVLCALTCATIGAPQAASDAPLPMGLAALPPSADVAASGQSRQVLPVRDPQIVVTRLPSPGIAQLGVGRPEDGTVGQGTMLLTLGAMLAWIALRRS